MTDRIVNLTPHPVDIVDADGVVLHELPSEGSARARLAEVPDGQVCGIPVVRHHVLDVTGLPDAVPGVWLVVSRTTADAAAGSGRDCSDLLVPTQMVRDEHGHVLGCQALSRHDTPAGRPAETGR